MAISMSNNDSTVHLCVVTDTETIVVIHRMFVDSCLVQVLAVLRRPQSPFVE